MTAMIKKLAALCCAAGLLAPAPQKPLFPSHLAPAAQVIPDELAAEWVAGALQHFLKQSGQVTPAQLHEIQTRITGQMRQNPWEAGLEWIWTDPNPQSPAFEFVLGGGLYTVRFTTTAPSWKYSLAIFRLDQFLLTSREPLLRTQASEEELGIPQRHIPTQYKPPTFEEEQDRLMAIAVDELYGEVLAWSGQAPQVRERQEMQWYEQRFQHFVDWADRLIRVFPEPISGGPDLRRQALQYLTGRKEGEKTVKMGARDLLARKNWNAALPALRKVRDLLSREGRLLKEARVEEMQWAPVLEEERRNTEALIRMGKFLVDGEGPVTRTGAFWKKGEDPLDGSVRRVKAYSTVHYASQRDHLFSRLATIGSIRGTQELFKIYLRKMDALREIASLFWETHELLSLQVRQSLPDYSPAPGDPPAERIAPRLRQLGQAQLEGLKTLGVLTLRECQLEEHKCRQDLEHHQRRLERLRDEESRPHTLRPKDKIAAQIQESEKAVENNRRKIAGYQASMQATRQFIQFVERLEERFDSFGLPQFEQVRTAVQIYLDDFIRQMSRRVEEKRVRSRDNMIRGFVFLHPNFLFPEPPAAPEPEGKKKRKRKPKPPRSAKDRLKKMDNAEWKRLLEKVDRPQYREAQKAFFQAYTSLVEVLYEQDEQVRRAREELREQREEFFRRVLRGLKIKGALKEAQALVKLERADLPALRRVFAKMTRMLELPAAHETSEDAEAPLPPADTAENPLTPRVAEALAAVGNLEAWYQNPARDAAMEYANELLNAFPPVAGMRRESFPPFSQQFVDGLRGLKEKTPALWFRMDSLQRPFEPARRAFEDLARILTERRELKERQALERGEILFPEPFPQDMIRRYQEAHRLLAAARQQEDPRLRLPNGMPDIKGTKSWAAVNRVIGDLNALLDPPQEAPAGSPLVRGGAREPETVAVFGVEAQDQNVIVTDDEGNKQTGTIRMYRLVRKANPGNVKNYVLRRYEKAIRRALGIPKEEVDADFPEDDWERCRLIRTIHVCRELNKMAEFDGAAGKVFIDEDLFFNERFRGDDDAAREKEAAMEGLLELELHLKLDHLEAIRDKEGAAAHPGVLALEKTRFLMRYIRRFLAQPLNIQDVQIHLLESRAADLDAKKFRSVLNRAQWYRRHFPNEGALSFIDRFVEPYLVPFLKQSYPAVLSEGMDFLRESWGDALIGLEGLEFGFAEFSEIEGLYPRPTQEQKGTIQRIKETILSQTEANPARVIKVTNADGELVAWALATKKTGVRGLFHDEGKTASRLLLEAFDARHVDAAVGGRDYLMPLLYAAARLAEEWSASDYIQIRFDSARHSCLERMERYQAEPPPFPGEKFADKDAPRDRFYSGSNLRHWFGWLFGEHSEDGDFYSLLREIDGKRAKLKTYKWLVHFDEEKRWVWEMNPAVAGSKKSPCLVLNLDKISENKRREQIADFLASPTVRSVVFWHDQIWEIEKKYNDPRDLPVLSEARDPLNALESLFRDQLEEVFPLASWNRLKEKIAVRFLREKIAAAVDERGDFISLEELSAWAWASGIRLRQIDPYEYSEWVYRDHDPEFDLGSEEARRPYLSEFWEIVLQEGGAFAADATDVNAHARAAVGLLESVLDLAKSRHPQRQRPKTIHEIEQFARQIALLDANSQKFRDNFTMMREQWPRVLAQLQGLFSMGMDQRALRQHEELKEAFLRLIRVSRMARSSDLENRVRLWRGDVRQRIQALNRKKPQPPAQNLLLFPETLETAI